MIYKQFVALNQYDSLKKEAEILSQLDHDNIVKFVKIYETEKRMFLVMELVKDGQLKTLIDDHAKDNRSFTDEQAATIMKGILLALQYIHSKDVIHRDLKPG